MADTEKPDYTRPLLTFLPWVRQGIVDAAARQGTMVGGRLALSFHLSVQGASAASVEAPIRLQGPGDVTGIDPREIVRTEPTHLTADFEADYFPAIEFDHPDFPWLFTPAAPQGNKLTPWLCLVVVERRGDVTLSPAEPLARLTCRRDDLPDLSAAWRWAHAQIAWTPKKNAAGTPVVTKRAVDDVIEERPERSISRILSMQPLVADRGYYACLVPTYLVGVKAGLGEAITSADESALAPAWTAVTSASPAGDARQTVTLPVYYHWEFATGNAVTFESLVRRLRARPLHPDVGKTELDVHDAGWGLPRLDPASREAKMMLEGALRIGATPVPPPAPQPAPATIVSSIPIATSRISAFRSTIAPRPEVPLAIKQALELILTRKPTAADPDPLVLPPVYGAIQAGVDGLPAEGATHAWLRELNLNPKYRVAAGLGALVVRYEQERLMAAAWDQAAEERQREKTRSSRQLAAQVHGSISDKLQTLQAERLAQVTEPMVAGGQSGIGSAGRVLSAEFRRLTRGQGPLARRMDGTGATALDGSALVRKASSSARSQPLATSAMSLKTAVSSATSAPAAGNAGAASAGLMMAVPTVRRVVDAPAYLASSARLKLTDALRAETAAGAEAPGPAATSTTEPTPLPSFDNAMYETLRDYFPELLLPGMERVEPNSVAILETNPRFIAAFMAGLNHEMSRELLWREFATDLRSTFFRRFWDAPTPHAAPDITAMRGWGGALGSAVSASPDGQLVLLIRGDLLRRFPGATIYAVKGALVGTTPVLPADGTPDAIPVLPIFRGTKAPDITFVGFPVGAAAALRGAASAGYFIVIQEQPTEPRFGWDAGNMGGPIPTDAAVVARRTLQQPFRIAIHADALLTVKPPAP